MSLHYLRSATESKQTDGPNYHASGTSGTSAAEQPLVPEASGNWSSRTFDKYTKTFQMLALVFVCLSMTGCLVPFPMIESVPMPVYRGSILSKTTGKPVSGARVAVVGHSATQTITDSKGFFLTNPSRTRQFTLLSSGYTVQTFRLRIAAEGYTEIVQRVERPTMIGNWDIVKQGIALPNVYLEPK